MAEENKSKSMKVHSDTSVYEKAKGLDDSGYGNYMEYNPDNGKPLTGGGEPMGKGQEKHPIGGRGTWTDNYGQKPKREETQPRTDDGKFTYNSVNGKGLSEKSNPNRNRTVNPLLTGGKVMMQDEFENALRDKNSEISKKFENIALVEKGTYVYRNKIYNIDGGNLRDALLELDKGAFDPIQGKQSREYYEKNDSGDNTHTWTRKGGFSGQISSGVGKKEAEGYKTDMEFEAKQKMGRRSKEEQEAIDTAGMQKNVMVKVGDKSQVLTKRLAKGPEFKPTKHNVANILLSREEFRMDGGKNAEHPEENRFDHDMMNNRTERHRFSNIPPASKQVPPQDKPVGGDSKPKLSLTERLKQSRQNKR